jgi:hypothetical protein
MASVSISIRRTSRVSTARPPPSRRIRLPSVLACSPCLRPLRHPPSSHACRCRRPSAPPPPTLFSFPPPLHLVPSPPPSAAVRLCRPCASRRPAYVVALCNVRSTPASAPTSPRFSLRACLGNGGLKWMEED